MANEDMDGLFLGGGAIDHMVRDGEIYLNADQLALLLLVTGSQWGTVALQMDDLPGATGAHIMLTLAQKLDELRSELLKREIEASFNLDN